MKSLIVLDNINAIKKQKEQFEREILKLEGSLNVFESLLKSGIKDIAIPEEENKEVIDEDVIRS